MPPTGQIAIAVCVDLFDLGDADAGVIVFVLLAMVHIAVTGSLRHHPDIAIVHRIPMVLNEDRAGI